MKENDAIAIIGGYDAISRSFYSKIKIINKRSIFINLQKKKITGRRIFNCKIFQLKKIIYILEKQKIKNLLFLGKLSRPDLSNFKYDGVIDKYVPILANAYKQGDGKVLSSILDIFSNKGFKILTPHEISKQFFMSSNEISKDLLKVDKLDISKSINILNDLSKYDNAQSIVIVNGYIIAIEAAEGTDKLLKRTASIRKTLGHIRKDGLLVKLPKKNQSKLIDLPVIGLKTLKLIQIANLKGIAINPKYTIIHEKENLLKYANEHNLKIYSAVY